MLVWNANFQIPNSGVQAAFVYMLAEKSEDKIILSFFSDENKTQLLFNEEIEALNQNLEIYDYILTLEKYQQYKKA